MQCNIHSVQFSRSVVSDSLRPHESQHARPPCLSPTPGVHSDSRPSSRWCHPAISLFPHWSPVAYWAPTDLGSSSFSILSFCLFILLQTNPVRFHFYEVPGGGGGFIAKLCQTVLHKVLRRVKFIESESTWVDAKGQGSREDGVSA